MGKTIILFYSNIYHRVNADTVAVRCSGRTGLLLAESESSVDDLVLCMFSDSWWRGSGEAFRSNLFVLITLLM